MKNVKGRQMRKVILNKLKIIIPKIKTNIDLLAIISVFGILVYRIDNLRKLCKNFCVYITTWYLDIDLKTIKNIYLWTEQIFRIIIVVFLATQFLKWMIGLIWEYWLQKQKGKNRFEESLFRYLHDSSIPRCFLVTGEWGSGKTYDVQDFLANIFVIQKLKYLEFLVSGLIRERN